VASYSSANYRKNKHPFFADDQVLKANSEKSAYIAKHSKNFEVEISPEKI